MPTNIVAVILAGGDGRRLGGVDKALVTLGDRRLIDHTYGALKDQVTACALSLRAPKPWTVEMGLPVLKDEPAADRGPLGGIAAALTWGNQQKTPVDWVLTVPVDVPFLPSNLANGLSGQDADVAVAASAGQAHHTIAAWRPALAGSVVAALTDHAVAVRDYQATVDTVTVDWPVDDYDPFMNINTPEDLALAQDVLNR